MALAPRRGVDQQQLGLDAADLEPVVLALLEDAVEHALELAGVDVGAGRARARDERKVVGDEEAELASSGSNSIAEA